MRFNLLVEAEGDITIAFPYLYRITEAGKCEFFEMRNLSVPDLPKLVRATVHATPHYLLPPGAEYFL